MKKTLLLGFIMLLVTLRIPAVSSSGQKGGSDPVHSEEHHDSNEDTLASHDAHNREHEHEGHEHEGHEHDGHEHDGDTHEEDEHEGDTQKKGEHDGHEHEKDEHGAAAHGQGSVEHDHESHAGGVHLTSEAKEMANIRLANVENRHVATLLELPGEVGYNEDNLAHVTPRYDGIVHEVRARLGQYVRQGAELAVIENNRTLSRYSVKAPISGTIIQKHITRGEYASGGSALYVIAHLATVWINLDVYPRHLEHVSRGGKVAVSVVGGGAQDSGTISYVTPFFDRKTRAATARVVLRNRDNRWRPGTFVTATMATHSEAKVPVVRNEAIQILDGEKCVFVPAGDGYVSVVIETGAKGVHYTEIVSGIAPHRPYVSHGAFELKAAIVTSSLDAHAGHGH